MEVVLWTIAVAVMVPIGLVFAALALPVHLRLQAETGEAGRVRAHLRLFGGLTPWIRLVDTGRETARNQPAPPAKTAQAPDEPARKKRRRRRGWLRPDRAMLRRALAALPDLIAGEVRRIHLDRLEIDADLGLDDPADTGRLFGVIMPLVYLPRPGWARLDLRPDFAGARFDGRALAALHLTPAALLGPVIRFAWAVFVRRS